MQLQIYRVWDAFNLSQSRVLAFELRGKKDMKKVYTSLV